jgi:hypothetical protein
MSGLHSACLARLRSKAVTESCWQNLASTTRGGVGWTRYFESMPVRRIQSHPEIHGDRKSDFSLQLTAYILFADKRDVDVNESTFLGYRFAENTQAVHFNAGIED